MKKMLYWNTNFNTIITSYIRLTMIVAIFVVLFVLQFTLGDTMSLEKRPTAPLPTVIDSFLNRSEINKVDLIQFPKQADAFYSDFFPMRNSTIQVFNQARLQLNQKSPSELVSLGKDGYFYYNTQDHRQIYNGENLFTDEELKRIGNAFIERRKFVEAQGKEYYIILSATKEEVYPEYVSNEWGQAGNTSRTAQLHEYLTNQGQQVYYTKPFLNTLKNEKQVFFKTDSHWNFIGAIHSYDDFLRSINKNDLVPVEGKDYKYVTREDFLGDMSWIMGTRFLLESVQEYSMVQNNIILPLEYRTINNNGKEEIVEYKHYTSDSSGPKLLLFRSSYHDNLERYINSIYSDIEMYKLPFGFDAEVVTNSDAPIVIQELSSASLYETLSDNNFDVDTIE